jgi:hypothetical protein
MAGHKRAQQTGWQTVVFVRGILRFVKRGTIPASILSESPLLMPIASGSIAFGPQPFFAFGIGSYS